MGTNQNQTSEVPKWIQTRSWEVELLISGGAIISLLQFHDLMQTEIDKILTVTYSQIRGFYVVLMSIRFLAIFFSIHLVTRAYWLALIFLNKLFPVSNNVRRSNLVEPYRTINERFDMVKRISNIDTFCSLMFCWSFTAVLVILGVAVSYTIIFLPASFAHVFQKFFNQMLAITIAIGITFFIFLFDLFTFGKLRQSRLFAKAFLPIYWFWNKASLGFIWRPNIELIFSKFNNKWTVSLIVISVFSISFFFTNVMTDYLDLFDNRKHSRTDIVVDENMYMDKYTPEQWQGTSIQSDVITDKCVKIFIPYSSNDDRIVGITKANNFSNIIKVSINDSTYSKLQWVGINKMNGQKGIQTVINISHLENMMHLLRIEELMVNPIIIPFWKQ